VSTLHKDEDVVTLAGRLLPAAASVYLALLALEEAEARGGEVPPQAHRALVVRMARQRAAEVALVARLAERGGEPPEPLSMLVSLEHSLLLLLEHEAEVAELPLLSAAEVEESLALFQVSDPVSVA